MDELAVADTGTAWHYLIFDSLCDKKKISFIPIPIRMPNGEIITSTHMALLFKPDLPIETQKANLFAGLNKAFVRIIRFVNL